MNSKIILCSNIHIDREYANVLSYSMNQMLALCQSNAIASADNYSFIRTNGNIYVNFPFWQCIMANYIAFQNPDYGNKWFFAWIDDVIYKSNENCEIKFTIDAWSTFFDDWTPKKCFINRQHVNDDTVGLHTLDENLNIGDLYADRTDTLNDIGAESYFYIVIACNYNPITLSTFSGMGFYAGYPQGTGWYAWLVNNENYSQTFQEISNWIHLVDSSGHSDWIEQIFALPYQAFSLIGDIDENSHQVLIGKGRKLDVNKVYQKSSFRIFDNFSPKNNKVYCYPYSFCRITNNSGSYNDYKIEDFNEYDVDEQLTDNMTFNLIGIPCLSYSGKIRPKFYRGIEFNEDESLQLGKYPVLSWSSDAFTNWLTQNGTNLTVEASTSLASSIVSMFTGNIAGGVTSIANTVSNTIGTLNKASMIPNTTKGNANAGDINFAFNLNRFKISHMRPKVEYLQIIDDYFTRFGYKINKLERPNIAGRRYWNYVEIGASEEIGTGSVPAKYWDTINSACRKGVTIWHNHENINNFDLNNSIV